MTIAIGDPMPPGTLATMTLDGVQRLDAQGLFAGRRVVLFAVPGAFTPTCSDTHLPGYLARLDDFKARGVDLVACLAVNDVYVMDAWRKARHADDNILMLADGNGTYVAALGLDVDLTPHGMGHRARRCAAIIEDGVVRALNVEPAGGVSVSGADAMLAILDRR